LLCSYLRDFVTVDKWGFQKVAWIFTAAFLTTLFIEGFQYLAKLGIFELDDLFHNTLGGMIGYSLFMFGYTIIKGYKKDGANNGTNIDNGINNNNNNKVEGHRQLNISY
jgi:glycopeptide antibiotics resistance protein